MELPLGKVGGGLAWASPAQTGPVQERAAAPQAGRAQLSLLEGEWHF